MEANQLSLIVGGTPPCEHMDDPLTNCASDVSDQVVLINMPLIELA